MQKLLNSGKQGRPGRSGTVPRGSLPVPQPAGRICAHFSLGQRPAVNASPVWGFDQGQRIAAVLRFVGSRALRDREVNEDKFGCFTPGSLIPIRPEQELFRRRT